MEQLSYLFFFLIFLNGFCQGNDLEYDGKLSIRLEHTLDYSPTPVFFPRGDISVKSLHSGIAKIEEIPLTLDQVKLLRILAEKNGDYRLQATVKTPDGKKNVYNTFVKACSLIESYMNNTISVNLDHNGNVIAVTMAVPRICVGSKVDDTILTEFDTNVEVRHMEPGPIPDTASYIQKIEKEREAKERGEVKDNRSFLGKYWMYIVPVVIFMLLPTATNTESGGMAQR